MYRLPGDRTKNGLVGMFILTIRAKHWVVSFPVLINNWRAVGLGATYAVIEPCHFGEGKWKVMCNHQDNIILFHDVCEFPTVVLATWQIILVHDTIDCGNLNCRARLQSL